jgi:glycosyltransferase involved in cell wall biosynthesis
MTSPVAPARPAPKASVVITTYRRPAMLEEVLDALCSQTRGQAVEVVIVDNCPDASARRLIEARKDPTVRYIHEARSGVVHARNCGVAATCGDYVIFLDDDEVPVAGWLDAWLTQADGLTDASFGRIVPRFMAPCPPDLVTQVERNFSREMHRPHGADISNRSAYLGAGNAMFHKARCLGQGEPFDLRFNARGGEDVWLIRGLVRRGQRLLWNHAALVEELVPADRMTLSSLRLRRFNQGQLRCLIAFGDGGLGGFARAAFWMLAGAIQLAIFAGMAGCAGAIFPWRRANWLCQASGGAGKLLWWRDARMRAYGIGG